MNYLIGLSLGFFVMTFINWFIVKRIFTKDRTNKIIIVYSFLFIMMSILLLILFLLDISTGSFMEYSIAAIILSYGILIRFF